MANCSSTCAQWTPEACDAKQPKSGAAVVWRGFERGDDERLFDRFEFDPMLKMTIYFMIQVTWTWIRLVSFSLEQVDDIQEPALMQSPTFCKSKVIVQALASV